MLGLDIGSANLKYIALDPNKKEVTHFGCVPLWSKRINLLKKTVAGVKHIIEIIKPEYVNIVSSFEIVEKKPIHILEMFYETLLTEFDNTIFYTLTRDCNVIDIYNAQKRASDLITSAVQGVAYIGTHIVDNGVLINMNSASTVVIPILKNRYQSISGYKFSSGEARWIGALYTPVETFTDSGVINGHITKLAPYGAHTVDVFNILDKSRLEEILGLYGVNKTLYPQEDSLYKIFHSLAYYPKNINKTSINQAKIFSLYIYHKLQDIIREMIFQIFSFLNLDPEEIPIITCGIGKDLILKNGLRNFNVHDISSYLSFPLWVYVEAFGSALALLEKIENKHINIAEVTINEESIKKNQGSGTVQF